MAKNESDYNGEIEMCATYAGGVLGGLTFGVFGDLLHTQVSALVEANTMAFYITGACLGAGAGFLAGKVFRRLLLTSEAEVSG